MEHAQYWYFCAASEVILLILWITTLQQLCSTNCKDKPRVYRIILVICNITSQSILNIVVYIQALYPNTKIFASFGMNITRIWFICESISCLMGCHVFCLLHKYIVATVYNSASNSAPKWFKYSINITELFMIVLVIICFTGAFITNDRNSHWLFSFYIIFGAEIFVACIFILYSLHQILKILHHMQTSKPRKKISAAIFNVRVARILSVLLMIWGFMTICLTLQQLLNFGQWSLPFTFITCTQHSLVMVLLSIATVLWIFEKPERCCCFPRAENDGKLNREREILLENSSINKVGVGGSNYVKQNSEQMNTVTTLSHGQSEGKPKISLISSEDKTGLLNDNEILDFLRPNQLINDNDHAVSSDSVDGHIRATKKTETLESVHVNVRVTDI